MISPKKQITRIMQEQPDDSSYDEILRELAFARIVDRGLADVKSKKIISNKEMQHRIRTWQK